MQNSRNTNRYYNFTSSVALERLMDFYGGFSDTEFCWDLIKPSMDCPRSPEIRNSNSGKDIYQFLLKMISSVYETTATYQLTKQKPCTVRKSGIRLKTSQVAPTTFDSWQSQ